MQFIKPQGDNAAYVVVGLKQEGGAEIIHDETEPFKISPLYYAYAVLKYPISNFSVLEEGSSSSGLVSIENSSEAEIQTVTTTDDEITHFEFFDERIIIDTSAGAIEQGERFKVTQKEVSSDALSNIKTLFGENTSVISAFQIQLQKPDSKKFSEPNTPMQVSIALNDSFSLMDYIEVIQVGEKDTIMSLSVSISDGYSVFETPSTGVFALVRVESQTISQEGLDRESSRQENSQDDNDVTVEDDPVGVNVEPIEIPITGDPSRKLAWLAMAICALLGIIILVIFNKKFLVKPKLRR
jgi:hypothetical protein